MFDGPFGKRAQALLEAKFGAPHALLTTSCTAALEMSALLCDLAPGDEVILPSYTFVSTANAIALRGARPVFVDIRPDTLNLDERLIEAAITSRTRAIWPVHYAGVACEMDTIMDIARRHRLLVVEDAAQGVFASYKGRWLGTIGDLGCYSFHETKNIACGEGGALLVGDGRLARRAEILREKGTNRSQFLRGQVDKYTWVDLGSSYGLSFYYDQFGSPTELKKVFSGRGNALGGFNYKYSGDTIGINGWQHLVVRTQNDTVTFFKNGVDMGYNQYGHIFNNAIVNQDIGVIFGKTHQNGDIMKGKIDDIGIWNRALNQQEITDLYNGVSSGVANPDDHSAFIVFPNPARQQIHIRSIVAAAGLYYHIYTLSGKEVLSGQLTGEDTMIAVGNLPYFSTGIGKCQRL